MGDWLSFFWRGRIVMVYGGIALLIGIIIYFVIKNYRWKKRMAAMIQTIDILLKEKNKLYIFSEEKDLLGDLGFKINELISAYFIQSEKYETEKRAKKELLSNLSHDVRTPLVSVIGYLEAVQQKRIQKVQENEYINTALEKALALKKCINQLFEFIQLDADEIVLSFEKIDICEALKQIIIEFIPYLEKEKIVFDANILEHEVFVLADKNAITRIFQNLIRNTLIHGKDGLYLGIFVTIDEGKVSINIKDKGKGIKEEHLPFIFERLYKADFSRNNGGGIGLAIAKELTEKMNGEIVVLRSVPGETIFHVSFPLIS